MFFPQHNMKIGIVGGSFNPFHKGHLQLGLDCLEEFKLDQVWFMPTGITHFKEHEKMLSGRKRLELIEAALQEVAIPELKACDMEIVKGGISYTWESYLSLKKQYPNYDFYWIFGADCLASIEYWKNSKELLSNCYFVFVNREGYQENQSKTIFERLKSVYSNPYMEFSKSIISDISSTKIRELISSEKNYELFVPQAVYKMIEEQGLYR